MTVRVIDPVADYAELMEHLFDFAAIRDLIASPDNSQVGGASGLRI